MRNFGITLWLACVLAAPTMAQTVGYTPTADSASAWLKALSLPTGAGGIGILTGSVGMMAFPPGPGRDYIDQNGVAAFYANAPLAQLQINTAAQMLRADLGLMHLLGAHRARSACMAPWGMLESAPGTYHFAYMDTTIKACGDYGVDVLMTLIPYADWASGCNTPHPQCDIFTGGGDYYFLNNNITGPLCPTDTLHWYNFVHTLVERYDGDGTDDMPGLAQPVLWYEFGNEPEGPCGNYDSAAYVRDYLTTLRALRDACPTCQLTNGGHLNSNDSLFWHYVIDHLAPHLGVGNIHVNEGKLAPVFGFAPYTGKAYSLFRNRLAANGSTAPLWMTEWGVYSGQPTTPLGDTLPLRTERAQAALYAKYATWGWANGLSLYYYDLKGTASNGIGSSALFEDGPTKKWRLAGLTVKLFDYFLRDATNGQQFVFATDPQLGAGHFRFVRNGLPLDVVWGLQNLPGNWQGQVVVWDVMGNADTLLIQQLPTPLGPEPRIIEWLPATGTPGVQPNPLASVVAQPNPLGPAAELTLHLAHPVPAWHIEAFAPNGQRVLQAQATGSTHTLPLAHLPAGVYALRLRAGAHTHTLRLWVP